MPVVSLLCCPTVTTKIVYRHDQMFPGGQNSSPVENHCFIEMRGQGQVDYNLSSPLDHEWLEGRKSELFYSLLCYPHLVPCLACDKCC